MNTSPSFEIPCVILCGGKSSRMGEDKALLPFSNYKTLSQYQYEKLKLYFTKIYLSSKVNKFDFLDDTSALIFDDGEIFSPIVAIKSILENISSEKVFIITVDTPFVSIMSIKKLIDESKNYEITIASDNEKVHNLCGVFHKNILKTIDKMLQEDIHKVGFLIKNSISHVCLFKDEKEFININNKEDYQIANNIIS